MRSSRKTALICGEIIGEQLAEIFRLRALLRTSVGYVADEDVRIRIDKELNK